MSFDDARVVPSVLGTRECHKVELSLGRFRSLRFIGLVRFHHICSSIEVRCISSVIPCLGGSVSSSSQPALGSIERDIQGGGAPAGVLRINLLTYPQDPVTPVLFSSENTPTFGFRSGRALSLTLALGT